MVLLRVENVRKSFGERVLLDGASLTVGEGERIGLVGANGSGKSSLLRILAGLDAPEEGTRTVRRGLRLGYLEQEPDIAPERTVRGVAREGLGRREAVLADLERVHDRLGDAGADLERLLARQSRLEEELERLGGHDVEHRIESTLTGLGLLDFDARCGDLSGGERRRVALARLFLGAPDLLLLDEPTNHLDAFVTDWLEDWFLETRTPLLLVTHDRYVLDRVVDRIVELDRGALVPYPGGYAEYLEARAQRLETEERTERSRLNLLRRETEWMRRGPPARTTKAKARIRRYADLEDGGKAGPAMDLELEIPPGPRLGSRVAVLSGVTKSYGGRVVLPPIDLELAAGERVGVVGPNGAGKTTLTRILLGDVTPDAGTREVGETVEFVRIDQMRAELDPERTVAETLAGAGDHVFVEGRSVRVQSFLDKFGFPPESWSQKVTALSGGERGRLLLARLLCSGGNVLVLDEPTNDLDLGTLRALEEALVAFPGTVVAVSHDRWFLDRIATRVVYLDGEGGARIHHGDVTTLLAEVARERAAAAATAARDKPAPRAKPRPEADTRPGKKRLTPWEERELGQLEERIGGAEEALAAIDAELADPDLYARPRPEQEAVQERRARADTELADLYRKWEALEERRGG